MKGLKATELQSWTDDQINKQIGENQSRITALNFQKTIGQLENFAQFQTLRRDIARLQTVLSDRRAKAKAAATTSATAVKA